LYNNMHLLYVNEMQLEDIKHGSGSIVDHARVT
jgi:hypothetical protein